MRCDPENNICLNPDKLPGHVAMIMDGNGRWAKKKLMNRVKGHEQGSNTVREVVTACREIGIKVLTLYAFSTENWARPKVEVTALMELLKRFLVSELDTLQENGICLHIIGQMEKLPKDVQTVAMNAISQTQNNSSMTLNLAISYGSRQEMLDAVKTLAAKARTGEIDPEKITEDIFSQHLYTCYCPDPDLIIRTSGEYRLSNFLLWQAAYSELYITPTLWPDFGREELMEILYNYQERDRRFGKI